MLLELGVLLSRGRQFKKVLLLKTFFNRFWPKSNWSTKHFSFDLNLEQHSSLKVRGSEINFIIQKLLESKNPRGFIIPVLKVSVTNPQGFFHLSNFYIIKLILEPLTLRPPGSSRLRSYEKSWGSLNFWGQNLLISVFQLTIFFNYPTPH